ncbi:MAG: uracil-DNA glycosylase, partial [Cyanobacteria bacterium Co-bin13]|nr:uracil-DNA glycosylase [Cyanobacteria bacterium Co-bin13]
MAEEQFSLFDSGASAPTAAANPNDYDKIPDNVTIPIVRGTYDNLEAIGEHCSRCYRCDLGQTRTHAVVSRGNPKANIMIVGEGPGQQEDEQGLPFVGKSGQLLEKILEAVRLDSAQDVFISNIVKCRPPENRVPTTDEMAACKGYLMEQIRMVDPKIILLTGATAVKGITGNKQGITKIRGQWIE